MQLVSPRKALRGVGGTSDLILFFHSNVVVFSFQMGVLGGPAASGVLWCFGVIRDGDTAISTAASIPFSEKFREHAGQPRRWSVAGGYKRG